MTPRDPLARRTSGAAPGPAALLIALGLLGCDAVHDGAGDEADGTSSAAPPAAEELWIEGRVVLPADLPPDAVFEVVARGRRRELGDPDSGVRRVRPGADGAFRVAVDARSSVATLDVDGARLYLPERFAFRPPDGLPDSVVLRPEVGLELRGRFELAEGVSWTEAQRRGASVSVMGLLRAAVRVRVAPEADGTFVFPLLPRRDAYALHAEVPDLHVAPRTLVPVPADGAPFARIPVGAGVRLAGRVRVPDGRSLEGQDLELAIDRTVLGASFRDDAWVPLAADGRFEVTGLPPGSYLAVLDLEGLARLERDLGELRDGDARVDLEMVVDAGRTLTGLVRWPDGRTTADVVVSAAQEHPGGTFVFADRRFEARTDEDGVFELRGLADQPLDLRAEPSELVEGAAREALDALEAESGASPGTPITGRTWFTPKGEPVELTLSPRTRLRGRVLDDLGERLRGVPVVAYPLDVPGFLPDLGSRDEHVDAHWIRESFLGVAESDAFAVQLQPGRWRLVALLGLFDPTGSDPRVEVEVSVPETTRVDLVVPRHVELRGEVRGPDGAPVGGALVVAEELAWGERWYHDTGIEHEARTSADGRFAIEGVRAGRVRLSATHADLAPAPAREVSGHALASGRDVVLQLRGRATLVLRLDPSLAPFDGRAVTVSGPGPENIERHDFGPGGVLEFESIPAGDYALRWPPPYALDVDARGRAESHELTLAPGERRTLVLGAPPRDPRRLFGTVTLNGAPAEELEVRAEGGGRTARTFTDAEGRYALVVDGEGPHEVRIARYAGTDEIAELLDVARVRAGGATPHDVAVETAELRGRVLDEDGAPAAGVWVTVREAPAGAPRLERALLTDARGTFRLPQLPLGAYHLRVNDPGGPPWSDPWSAAAVLLRSDVTLARRGETVDFAFRLEPGAYVRGVAVDAEGEPVEFHELRVTDGEGLPLGVFAQPATGADGRFHVGGLRPGPWRVALIERGPDDEIRELGRVEVEAVAGETHDVRLVLDP